jgi:anaerobic magnesium-protoporphyrin IX monomethyl ester cyclase
MRILFTHSYFLQFDPKQWEQMQPYAPLGTIYAAALVRENGFDVALHDVMFLNDPNSIAPILNDFKPDILVIYDDGFNYLTKMCLTNMREAAYKMAQLAKKFGCITIASSSDATDHYSEYLEQGIDYVILGEAEHTLLQLVQSIKNKEGNPKDILGLVYKTKEHLINTGKRPVLTDLDSLPFPAWDLVDVEQYRNAWLKKNGYFSINFATTRGCPYKCNWCAKPIYGNRYNARTAQHVFDELKLLHDQYQFDHIWFCDDIFGLKPGWVKEFASLLTKSNLRIKFKIQSRADLLLNDAQVKPLAEAGCETVWMGAESGSQKILDAMEKGTTVAQIAQATTMLKEQKIEVAFFIQFGYLGETKEDIELTLKMIEELKPDIIGISVSYPLPGTSFFEKVKRELETKSNWTDSDDLAMMFKGTFNTDFYRKLHRFTHKKFKQQRNLERLKGVLKQPQKIRLADLRTSLIYCYYSVDNYIAKKQLEKMQNTING